VFDVIPAIDVANGQVVRLLKGDPARVTRYGDDPVAVARRIVDDGARALHVVDLDAAFGRGELSEETLRAIIRIGVPVEVGGGVRTPERAERLVEVGVARVVVGSLLADADALARVVERVGAARVAAAVDMRAGRLQIRGWQAWAPLTADSLAERLWTLGITRVIVTAVERDGTGAGPDYALTASWVARGFSVYAAGGVASPMHLLDLKRLGARGAILGRALYEGTMTVKAGWEAVC
jgi:phosphoribosylformimino-5-aminoimidazole carboxamide ribotide isomerase